MQLERGVAWQGNQSWAGGLETEQGQQGWHGTDFFVVVIYHFICVLLSDKDYHLLRGENCFQQSAGVFHRRGVADKHCCGERKSSFLTELNKRWTEVSCCCMTQLKDCYWTCGSSFDAPQLLPLPALGLFSLSPASDVMWLSLTVIPLLLLAWEIWAYRQD